MDYVSAYENYLLNVKRSSSNTVASYLRDIRQFGTYLDSVEAISVAKCDRECICRYSRYLNNHGKSSATVARSIKSATFSVLSFET